MADTVQETGCDPLRIVEAILFAAEDPVPERELARRLPAGTDIRTLLGELERVYAGRGVVLVRAGRSWAFNTAPDLAAHLQDGRARERRLSRAAIETLAIIAYHQPVSRGEIEEIRGVQVSRGTIDVLLDEGWIAPGGRRDTPGRPVTWGTTDRFLRHFGLKSLRDLPDIAELRASGLLDDAPAATLGLAHDSPADDQAMDPEMDADGTPEQKRTGGLRCG
jgi:segregation and condensation protein B